MFLRILGLATCFGVLTVAGELRFSEHILKRSGNEIITGYALQERTLVTWGDRLLWRSLPTGKVRVVRGRGRAFAEGGCLLDVDGDGRLDVVGNEASPRADLAWFRAQDVARDWVRQVT